MLDWLTWVVNLAYLKHNSGKQLEIECATDFEDKYFTPEVSSSSFLFS